MRHVRGVVSDSAFRPLEGARVEAVEGAGAGAAAVVGGDGAFLISGAFDGGTRFRAAMDGHETVTQTWSCSVPDCAGGATPWTMFYLRPLSPPAIDLGGEYTMTLTAAASCATLPAETRSRTYRVTLAPRMRTGTADVLGFLISYHSGAVIESLRGGYFGVAGNYVRSYMVSGEGDEPGLIEWLDDTGYVAFTGTAEAALSPGAGPLTLSFHGQVEYLQLRAPISDSGIITGVESRETCTSTEHRMVLTRQ